MSAFAYRVADLLARTLPARATDTLASLVALAAWFARVPARGVLLANLARTAPDLDVAERARLGRRTFVHFARSFAGFLRLPRTSPHELTDSVRVRGEDLLSAARLSGRGVIVLSAHVGDWERGAAYLAARGLPVWLAARRHEGAAVEALFANRRRAFGVGRLPETGLFAAAAANLRRGGWIALMADRGTRQSSGATSVCAWAAALARRTGAIVLPVVLVREDDGSHSLCVERPLSPESCRDGAFRDAMRSWVVRWPGQWAAFETLPDGLA